MKPIQMKTDYSILSALRTLVNSVVRSSLHISRSTDGYLARATSLSGKTIVEAFIPNDLSYVQCSLKFLTNEVGILFYDTKTEKISICKQDKCVDIDKNMNGVIYADGAPFNVSFSQLRYALKLLTQFNYSSTQLEL